MRLVALSACLLAPTALPAAEPVAASVEHATYHRLVFATADLALFDNVFPPGSDSGFHRHPRELFYITLVPADASTQKPGQPVRRSPTVAPGSVGYNVLGDAPFIHRVINHDRHDYRVIGVEIRRPAPLGTPLATRDENSVYEQVFDHPRLRAWRLVLQPGQTAPAVRQAGDGVRVIVRGGLLTVAHSGLPDQTLVVAPGDAAQTSAGPVRALKNKGSTVIELVEVELK